MEAAEQRREAEHESKMAALKARPLEAPDKEDRRAAERERYQPRGARDRAAKGEQSGSDSKRNARSSQEDGKESKAAAGVSWVFRAVCYRGD